ncbi:MAG: PorT family protein [Cytophagaceae bacterium]|nr:PorT family protein [Cytophagaceae bacterium]MDW8457025.1 outer membrane beta-barrel protein [Cytophagaceae bacterium]
MKPIRNWLLLLFQLLVLFCTQSLQAQIKLGVTAFPQISMLPGIVPFKKDLVNKKNLPTPTWGAGIQFVADSRKSPWGIQTGVHYTAHNQTYVFNYKIADERHIHRGKKRFDYLEFPVLLRRSGLIHKYVTSAWFAGAQFGYLLKYDGGLVVYDENNYFDLPPTRPNIFYKKYSVDLVLGWCLEHAISKHFDLFYGVKLDWGLNNVERRGVTYNGYQVFDAGGAHQVSLALQLGAYYVFHRRDHLLLPTNTWRYRAYKRRRL